MKVVRKKQLITYTWNSARLTADFLSETMYTKNSGMIQSKCWKKKKLSNKNSTPRRAIFKNESKIKTFTEKEKPREFITSRSSLKEVLKRGLENEMKVLTSTRSKEHWKGNYIDEYKRQWKCNFLVLTLFSPLRFKNTAA